MENLFRILLSPVFSYNLFVIVLLSYKEDLTKISLIMLHFENCFFFPMGYTEGFPFALVLNWWLVVRFRQRYVDVRFICCNI